MPPPRIPSRLSVQFSNLGAACGLVHSHLSSGPGAVILGVEAGRRHGCSPPMLTVKQNLIAIAATVLASLLFMAGLNRVWPPEKRRVHHDMIG